MRLQKDVKPITALETGAVQLIRAVADQRRTVVLTDAGEAKAVLMDVASFDLWRQTASLLKLIAQSEADFEAGRVVSQTKAFERAERAVDRVAGGH